MPEVTRRELALAALVSVALSLAMHWSVVGGMSDHLPGDVQDPGLEAWQVAWGGHAMTAQPLHAFDANTFWPLHNSLAFSDSLIGYSPAGLFGSGPGSAVIRYNILFLFASALAFLGAYLLAREIGARPAAALVAGAAFAYAPYRLSQVRHLHVLSSGGIALSIFLLARGWRRRSPATLLAGWVAAAWQVSLGFSLGLALIYVLAIGSVVLLVSTVLRRTRVERRVMVAFVAGGALFAICSLTLAMPYLEALRDHPGARRTVREVTFYSPPKMGVLAAPSNSALWGDVTSPARDRLPWPEEQTLFPGLIVPILAAAGVAAGRARRPLRAWLCAGVIGVGALSLGFRLFDGWLGYRLLYHLPGWDGIRTPGRLMTLVTLMLAVLAALGADRLTGSLRRGAIVTVSIVALAIAEGAGTIRTVEVPPAPAAMADAPGPQLHLPFAPAGLYMLWSTDGFPPIVNGSSGVVPDLHEDLQPILLAFPDEASVRALSDLGVRTVLLHARLVPGTPWADAAARDLGGLPVARSDRGDVIVYTLNPPG